MNQICLNDLNVHVTVYATLNEFSLKYAADD